VSRSESVRQDVLERDGRRCQVCGKSTDLNTHHIQPLGMGGSEEKDVAENMITLCSGCHRKIHAGTLHIESFTSDELIITDGESRRIPDSELWFYQRQRVERLEQAEARLIGLQAIEEAKARDLWELATGDPPGYTLLDGYSEGETFSEYVSGRNISVRLANAAVEAYAWITANALVWPQGLRLEKVNLIRRVSEQIKEQALEGKTAFAAEDWKEAQERLDNVQKWLDGAVDPSYQTVKQNLIDAGLKTAQAGWYFVFPGKLLEQAAIMPVYTRDLGKLLDEETGSSNVVIRVWGFKRGLHRDPATGGLTLFGTPLPFEDLTKERHEIDTVEEAKKVAEAICEDFNEEAT